MFLHRDKRVDLVKSLQVSTSSIAVEILLAIACIGLASLLIFTVIMLHSCLWMLLWVSWVLRLIWFTVKLCLRNKDKLDVYVLIHRKLK